MTTHSSGHYFLEGLQEMGLTRIFANLGTDHVTLIEELARWRADGRAAPEVITAPHENVAVHMAGGYAMATGQGQVVVVHVDAGTANSAMGLHNLARSRVPVFLMAGRAPHTIHGELVGSRDNFVHFVQDPFDMNSVVRPYVKWEYSLATGVNVKEVLRRGHTVMESDPPGPVYMTLPREVFAAEWPEEKIASYPAARYGSVQAGAATPEQVEAIASAILAAEKPVVITSYLGRKAEAVAALDALCREAGIAVVETTPVHLNIPHDSPCFVGADSVAAMEGADLGILLDTDVPYLPQFAPKADQLRWLQVDVDAVKKDFPMWGFPADLRVQADCAAVLPQVLEVLRAKADDAFRRRAADRLAALTRGAEERQQRRAQAAAKTGEQDAVSVAYLGSVLAEQMRPQDILVNEAVRNAGTVGAFIPRTVPGTYLGSAGGGLGFSGGVALGAKMARPDARVVQVVGDGVFHFTAPDAVYATAQQYRLPILTVVLDNRGWNAVKAATLRTYPNGAAKDADQFHARLDGREQGVQRRFEKVGEAFGAHGEMVSDPAELPAAVKRCFDALERGVSAVLNVRIAPL
ncbi:thiamine pyrophosphate-requiring protein [Roseomonas sp. BN140053]|uniref:thiamine pyrophosphate-requiring protein n=1 Tax=Roseomonas sp. BN140053 TaxID=3391898 RepID=UPI0039E91B24